jgi:hypothetical protein
MIQAYHTRFHVTGDREGEENRSGGTAGRIRENI